MRLTSWFGFPRKPWEELDKIITSRKTKQTWESGEMEEFGSDENFRKQLKVALPNRVALQEAGSKDSIIGPMFKDSSEFSDIPSWVTTIRLKYPATTEIKDELAKALTYFENKYKVPGMRTASTNFGWYDKLPTFLPSFFRAWLKDRVRVDQLVVNNPKAAKRLAGFI